MRFLGIGDSCDLAALYLRLAEDGHEVKVSIAHPLCQDTLAGLVDHVDRDSGLAWIEAAGGDGCVLFENVGQGRGELQDSLRQKGIRVIGSSAFGAKLENERGYAQRLLSGLGFAAPSIWEFTDRAEAQRFTEAHPNRYVLKFNGPDAATFVGTDPRGEDVSIMIQTANAAASSLILMEFIDGIEMGVGAYFNGEAFLTPACLDWEHKRFFPGDLGELTGEMGTVVTYSRTNRFFELTLRKLEPLLREQGYCGYINLNTIVNEAGIWPLEFTCRFGYPGFAILEPLQRTTWGDLFEAMLRRSRLSFEVEPGFAVGIVLTTPPFPYSREYVKEPVGLPISFDASLTPAERRHLHFGEVGLKGDKLVTSGAYGWTLVVTGVADTVADARDSANRLAEKVRIANMRYRRDIGDKLIAGDFHAIESLGLLD